MTKEEIEEFIEGIDGLVSLEEGVIIPGIEKGFVGWDDWNYRAVYDWKLCLSSLTSSRGQGREEAEERLNQLRQQSVDLAEAGGYEPPVFIETP
jgi:hypothetical protein